MTSITIVKVGEDEQHRIKLEGLGEKDRRAYARFRKMLRELGDGEFFTLNYWFPRNGKFHRKHMKMVNDLFDSQEKFEDDYQFRKYLEMGAGFCDWAPGAKGAPIAIPKSIAYDKLDDEGLSDLHEKIKAFVRGARPQRFLWPHLGPEQRAEMVETVVHSFEEQR